MRMMPGSAAPGSHQPPPGQPGKPGEPPKKPGESAKPAEGPKPLQRPDKPSTPPKPEELKVRPNAAGKVGPLSFNGQPWPAVLEWVADISAMSLDWQELPSDYLNLSTRHSYTVPEVRDLINRHLLLRGFTLLRQGEMLTVVNLKKLDLSLVPRVDPEQLENCTPYEFVKVTFPLQSLVAETTAQELKPMLSPNGKINAIPEVNLIEAIDTATNLCDIHALLKKEQSAESQQRLVRKFKLRYARATDVRDDIQTLLGSESKPAIPGGQPQNPAQAQQQAMMMQRMQQGGGQPGQPGQPGGGQPPKHAASPKGPVTLVADERQNTILATAPADKMAIIVQAVEALDVPTDADRTLLGNLNRMQVYRLAGIDPEPVVKTLQEIGNLSPATRLEVDKQNKAIIAYAPLADQVVIRTVVAKLSGSERSFEVIQLRKLRADAVAASIQFMMGVEPKKKKERSNPWYFGPSPSSTSTEKPNEFRVDADVEQNRLLLLANDIELGEVRTLLEKLGEISPKDGNNQTMRVIDAGDPHQTQELLDRIRRAWPSVAPNPLSLPPAAPTKETPEAAPSKPLPTAEPSPSKSTAGLPVGAVIRLAELRRDANAEEAAEASSNAAGQSAPAVKQDAAKPPVKVSVGPNGKLILSSEDTKALDLLEDLVAELAPPRKEYAVFRLKRAGAYAVSLNLEDYFKEEKKDQSRLPWFFRDYSNEEDDSNDLRLSKRRKLKFIPDSETNTILVEGADSTQLKTIKDLVELYDQPPPSDSQMERKTATIHLQYTKAKAVADTIKEVYRDLLSENDKALAEGNQPRGGVRRNVIVYSESYDDVDKTEHKVPKFKGMLSIGVDEVSNSLVVSAPAFLFDHVGKMIKELDDSAAENNVVRVLKVGHGVTADQLRGMLDAVQGQGSTGKSSREGASSHHRAAKSGAKPGAKTTAGSSSEAK